MRIGIWLSSLGGSPLQHALQRDGGGLNQLGHQVETYRPGRGYDLVLCFNQCAHDPAYIYPAEFPAISERVCFIDTAEYGWWTRRPDTAARYANTFSAGSLAHDTKSRAQQEWLLLQLEGRSFPYFLREMSLYVSYPEAYHPIDYPLYHLSMCNERPNREQYLARPLDLFVSWGASHPWRLSITEALRRADCRSFIQVIGESLTPQQGRAEVEAGAAMVERMPQAAYFEHMRNAKASASYDGYGAGSFRVTEAVVRTMLLQAPWAIHQRAPLRDGETCIEYQVRGDGNMFLSTDADERLSAALQDPERCYGIYERGYEHCMTHYTERATAAYILETACAHDWGRPTRLDLGPADFDKDGDGHALPCGDNGEIEGANNGEHDG